jgi:hypothetical protein
MAQSCASRYPQLSDDALRALKSWQIRNSNDAKASAKQCRIELRGLARSKDELKANKDTISKQQTAWKSRYSRMVLDNGVEACKQVLSGMEDPSGDLKNYLK